MTFHTIDLARRADIPAPRAGYRWVDFIGGTANIRCFEIPSSMTRSSFMVKHAALLGSAHEPVYEDGSVCVRQDASYALPGFYVVAPVDGQYPAIDDVGQDLTASLFLTVRRVRAAMRAVLGIEYIHMHCEEKASLSSDVHVWLVPVDHAGGDDPPPIMRLNLRNYLDSFEYSETGQQILNFNNRMRHALTVSQAQEYLVPERQ